MMCLFLSGLLTFISFSANAQADVNPMEDNGSENLLTQSSVGSNVFYCEEHPNTFPNGLPAIQQSQQKKKQQMERDVERPYKHSLGIVGGSLNGISYKLFPAPKFSIIFDLGVRLTEAVGAHQYVDFNNGWWITRSGYYYGTPITLELNVNFMRQGHFVKGLYGMIGGGSSYGWHFGSRNVYYYYTSDYGFYSIYGSHGKAGWNLFLGLEYVFDAPLSLQVDFRPGFGLLFSPDYTAQYFDWALNLSFRYTFKEN